MTLSIYGGAMIIGRENEHVEFKKSTAQLKEGIIAICAMLNKHGKGTLYFGVLDDGEVVGQQIGKKTLNNISMKINESMQPSCLYEINQHITAEGKEFVEINFSGTRTPYSAFGRYYIRFHDENRQMDNELLRNYYLNQKKDYSSWETASSDKCISDVISEKDVLSYYERGKKKGRIDFDYTSTKKVIGRLGLLFDGDTLNNAGNVLFSKERPVRIKLLLFASETRLTILKANPFEGNVFECIDAAMDFYKGNIGWKMEHTGDVRRREVPEIPLEAIREIVVNAFSHGNYDSSTDFEFAIFSDRVSIYSPGFFPKPYTPEQFAAQGIEPIPLNTLITKTLFRDGTVEESSTGFERTFKYCKDFSIDYEYEETVNGFRFTFFRGRETKRKTTEREKELLKIIEKDPTITIDEMSLLMGVSKSTIQRSIRRLKENGQLSRNGSDKNGTWTVHIH